MKCQFGGVCQVGGEPPSHCAGLGLPGLGERRIQLALVAVDPVPFGLAVTDEVDLGLRHDRSAYLPAA